MVLAADKVGSDPINLSLMLQGSQMQTRVVCGRHQLRHIVKPMADVVWAFLSGRCEADASTVLKGEGAGDGGTSLGSVLSRVQLKLGVSWAH